MARARFQILVCRGPECGDQRGSAALYDEFKRQIAARGASAELAWQSCFGRCTQGPNVLVRELGTDAPPARRSLATPAVSRGRATALYNGVTVARVEQIVEGHLVGGRIQRQFIERPRMVDSRPIAGRGPSEDSE